MNLDNISLEANRKEPDYPIEDLGFAAFVISVAFLGVLLVVGGALYVIKASSL